MNQQMTPEFAYTCLREHFIPMPLLDNCLILACILKQLRPKLLINPWDGLTIVGIEWFRAMLCDMIKLLCAKFAYNFSG